ncbi:choice-of-anchor J domain-containing protein [Hymenobacter sp. ASUV-10]|uniref:Choice-of-anchor J domain-containing protein n=1 Tax=Hymenobacter aranciens TaxID=3063996 RepID=A0ABT9B7Y0_9BACT|nr:choice-of-anchor J domain-containing protein [Hymenobacter sp. ASUV-10]MDO7874379.1 choice-of-anchor J domain-containing protein [Hymenobacter sp. ASUV-10]
MKTLHKCCLSSLVLVLLAFMVQAQAPIPRQGYLRESFEATSFPPPGWRADNVSGSNYWQREDALTLEGQGSAALAPWAGGTDDDWLILPRFRVGTTDSLCFYWLPYFVPAAVDSFTVKISVTDSARASFTRTLWRADGPAYPTGWFEQVRLSLAAYAGQRVYLAFQYGARDGAGMVIDDVELGRRPAADVRLHPLQLSSTTLRAGQSLSPRVEVQNMGAQPQTVAVTLRSTPAGYLSTRTVTVPAHRHQVTVNFDPWTPAQTGSYQLVAQAPLIADAQPTDNEVSANVGVFNPLLVPAWQPHAPLPNARNGHGTTAYTAADGTPYLLSVGGLDSTNLPDGQVWRYHPGTRQWVARAPMPQPRAFYGAHTLGARVYVPGGADGIFLSNASSRLDIYDPERNTWTTGPSLPQATAAYGSATLGDSLLYVVGGLSGNAGGSVGYRSVQVFDVRRNRWAQATPYPGPALYGLSVGVVGRSLVLVGGEEVDAGQVTAAVWRGDLDPTDPLRITWTRLPDYPGGPVRYAVAAGAEVEGHRRVYVTGGQNWPNTPAAQRARTWAYDLDRGEWLLGPAQPLPMLASYAAPITVGDSVYLAVAGGFWQTDGGSFRHSSAQHWLPLGRAHAPADVVVSSTRALHGTYRHVTITGPATGGPGLATLDGPLVVEGNLIIHDGGTLRTACQPLTGPGSFTLAAGAELVVCDAAGIAANGSTGAIQVTGTRSFSTEADYSYDGLATQITGSGLPAQVRSLTSIAPLTLSQPVAIRQTLTVNDNDLQLNGHALTLLSDASGTALVVNSGRGMVRGSTATVQRWLDPSLNAGPGYRHYSSPVSGNTLADLATPGFIPAFNPAYNSSAAPGLVAPFPTVFGYNQARLASATNNLSMFDKGWFSPSATDSLPAGTGYTVHLPATAKVDFTGRLRSGDYSLSLARNAGTTAAEAGWALVGNPYPAPLDWSLVAPADRPGLDAALYVFESTGPYAGQYRTFLPGASDPASVSPLVASSQGFFVRVSPGRTGGNLIFRNSQRLTTYGTQVKMHRSSSTSLPSVGLTLTGANGLTDELLVYSNATATTGLDPQADAVKLPNTTGLNLASLAATGEQLAIDGRPSFTSTTSIPLFVGVPALGRYTLTAAHLANLVGVRVELVDQFTGTRTLLTAGASYTFTLSSYTAPGRFWLNLKPATAPLATAAPLDAQVLAYPSPAHDHLTVLRPAGQVAAAELLNSLGQCVRHLALPAAETTVELHGLAAGVYALRFTLNGQPVTKRIVIE